MPGGMGNRDCIAGRIGKFEAPPAGEAKNRASDQSAGGTDHIECRLEIIYRDHWQRCIRGFAGIALQSQVDVAAASAAQ